MPNTVLTVDYLWDKVNRALGVSGVDIELVKADVEDTLEDALREYNRVRPHRIKSALAITAVQKKYQIDDLIPELAGIVDVSFVREGVTGTVDPFDPWFLYLGGSTGSAEGYTPAEYEQAKGNLKDAQKVFGSNPSWRGQWEPDGHYYLYIDVMSSTFPWLCSYTATIYLTMTDDADKGLPQIQRGDVKWVCDYCIAKSKLILSYVRGKYMGIPGPDGDAQIDWDRLKEEGERDEEKLMEQLKDRRRPLPPIIG